MQYAIKIRYEMIEDSLPGLRKIHPWIEQELELGKSEYEVLNKEYKKQNWHQKSVKDLAAQAGFEQLYRTFYKEASAIAHGDSFVLLRRRHFKSWDLAITPERFARYIEIAARFSYLMMATLFGLVTETFNLRSRELVEKMSSYIDKHPEYAIPPELH